MRRWIEKKIDDKRSLRLGQQQPFGGEPGGNFFDLRSLKILAEKRKVKSIDYVSRSDQAGKGKVVLEFQSPLSDKELVRYKNQGFKIHDQRAEFPCPGEGGGLAAKLLKLSVLE